MYSIRIMVIGFKSLKSDAMSSDSSVALSVDARNLCLHPEATTLS
jgi:hypothetical protein